MGAEAHGQGRGLLEASGEGLLHLLVLLDDGKELAWRGLVLLEDEWLLHKVVLLLDGGEELAGLVLLEAYGEGLLQVLAGRGLLLEASAEGLLLLDEGE